MAEDVRLATRGKGLAEIGRPDRPASFEPDVGHVGRVSRGGAGVKGRSREHGSDARATSGVIESRPPRERRLASSRMGVSRRDVVAWGIMALGALGARWVPGPRRVPPDAAGSIARQLFQDPSQAAELGRRYLAQSHDHQGAQALAEALEAGGVSLLRRLRSRDLRSGKTVVVGGWVLARTEARLCALVACGEAAAGRAGRC